MLPFQKKDNNSKKSQKIKNTPSKKSIQQFKKKLETLKQTQIKKTGKKQKRKVKNRKRKHDQTPHRLQQREKVKRAQISKLKRPIEDTENETQYIHGI